MDNQRFKILGRNIASLRKSKGWKKQDAFAFKVGIGISSLKDIERGKSEGRIETREAIATALGVTVSELYANPAAPLKLEAPPKISALQLTPEILAEFKTLNKAAIAEALEEAKPKPSQTFEYYSTPKQELIALIQGVDDKFAGELLSYVRVKLRKPTMDQKKSTHKRS